jgi:hypothetical protein
MSQKKRYAGLAALAVIAALGVTAVGASAETPVVPISTIDTAATREAKRQAEEFVKRAAPPKLAKTLGGPPVAAPQVTLPAASLKVSAGDCSGQAAALREGKIASYRCVSARPSRSSGVPKAAGRPCLSACVQQRYRGTLR